MLYRYWFPLRGKATAITAWAASARHAKLQRDTVWQSYVFALGGGLIYHIERIDRA